jgi:hypothetical protein
MVLADGVKRRERFASGFYEINDDDALRRPENARRNLNDTRALCIWVYAYPAFLT